MTGRHLAAGGGPAGGMPPGVVPPGARQPITFADAVLEVVASIPAGQVMTYGDVATYLGSGSPRSVGQVLARRGDGTAWHRVVMADGRPPAHQLAEQLRLLAREGASVGQSRVDIASARWHPEAERHDKPLRPPNVAPDRSSQHPKVTPAGRAQGVSRKPGKTQPATGRRAE